MTTTTRLTSCGAMWACPKNGSGATGRTRTTGSREIWGRAGRVLRSTTTLASSSAAGRPASRPTSAGDSSRFGTWCSCRTTATARNARRCLQRTSTLDPASSASPRCCYSKVTAGTRTGWPRRTIPSSSRRSSGGSNGFRANGTARMRRQTGRYGSWPSTRGRSHFLSATSGHPYCLRT